MPLIVTVNTTAECLRTDCNILGDNKKFHIKMNGAFSVMLISTADPVYKAVSVDRP